MKHRVTTYPMFSPLITARKGFKAPNIGALKPTNYEVEEKEEIISGGTECIFSI